MKIVLGLGNPGERYRSTRHNVGFHVVDLLARRAGARFSRRSDALAKAWTAEAEFGGRRVVLAKPRTYMNRSGAAALALAAAHGASPEEILVVFDDADLALGRVRVRAEGRAGGHNGIRSLLAAFRTERFPRVKLGVKGLGRTEADLADYVLEPFDAGERAEVERMIPIGADAVEAVLKEGLEAAMREFNGRSGG